VAAAVAASPWTAAMAAWIWNGPTPPAARTTVADDADRRPATNTQAPARCSSSIGTIRRRVRSTTPEEITMTATYTFDIFTTLDGYGSYDEHGDWGGYWGKHGPEFLARRLDQYLAEQRLVLGANTFREFVELLGPITDLDPVNARMSSMPTTVVSNTLEEPLDWPNATLVRGDAVDVVARLKEESGVPLRSHGSLSMNRSLMAAGLVDRVQVTLFPVISGRTGTEPIFRGAADFDLELIESRTLDGNIQELVYRPTLHG
jgi:dihydrofolate reductase